MLDLFEEYKSNGKITEALLVGRNLFNRNPSDANIFQVYVDYLCTLANSYNSNSDSSERRNYAEQANIALAFYSENADLTIESIETIFSYQQYINDIFVSIDSFDTTVDTLGNGIGEGIAKHFSIVFNDRTLKELDVLRENMQGSTTQEYLDSLLKQIGQVDERLDKDKFSDEQRSRYETLTKEFTELIQKKMREFEYKKSIDYNKEAADAFASAFKRFRKDENKYKDQDKLFSLASTTLFAFDASLLFNETLIYYNHVYSYIFSKLDDDGKFALTRYSIECERRLG